MWTRSVLAQGALADAQAVQWRLPELVLWPEERNADRANVTNSAGVESAALAELRPTCAAKALAKTQLTSGDKRPARVGVGLDPCLRNLWLHNLTQFLAARKRAGVVSVGR